MAPVFIAIEIEIEIVDAIWTLGKSISIATSISIDPNERLSGNPFVARKIAETS
jgi:hypothetical protein